MKIPIFLLLSFFIFACSKTTDSVINSGYCNSEIIAKDFGVNCTVRNEKKSENGNSQNNLIIELADSEHVKEYIHVALYPACKLAYDYYKEHQEALSNYHAIKIDFTFDGKSEFKLLEFSISGLKEFDSFLPVFYEASDKIRNKAYGELAGQYANRLSVKRDFEVEMLFSKFEAEYGEVIETEFFGCGFNGTEDNKLYGEVSVSGLMHRERGTHPIEIFLMSADKKIESMQTSF